MKVLSYNFSRNWLLAIELYKYMYSVWKTSYYAHLEYCFFCELLWTLPSSLVVRSVAPSCTALQSCYLHGYSIQREELLACGSAMDMRHLSVTLSVEFADADTIQKAHYRAGTDHRSDYRCITFCNASFVTCFNCLHGITENGVFFCLLVLPLAQYWFFGASCLT